MATAATAALPPCLAASLLALSARLRRWRHPPAAALPVQLALARGARHRASLRRGDQVHCHRGLLWLTIDGRPEDVLLEAGEHWRAPGRACIVLQAFEPAELTLA